MKNCKRISTCAFSSFLYIVIILFITIITANGKCFAEGSTPLKAIAIDSVPFTRYSISCGLSTSWIVGNNPNSTPIYNYLYTKDSNNAYGAGFNGSQPGILLRFTYTLDDESKYEIPFGVDYTFYSSGERVPDPGNITHWFSSTTKVLALFAGFDYFFWKVPYLNVRTYLGAEFRASFIGKGVFTHEEYDNNADTSITTSLNTKSSAIRYGGDFKVGFEGVIVHPIYLNASIGAGAINIFGRNNSRGELFVPLETIDMGNETLTYNLYFTLLLQYKF